MHCGKSFASTHVLARACALCVPHKSAQKADAALGLLHMRFIHAMGSSLLPLNSLSLKRVSSGTRFPSKSLFDGTSVPNALRLAFSYDLICVFKPSILSLGKFLLLVS